MLKQQLTEVDQIFTDLKSKKNTRNFSDFSIYFLSRAFICEYTKKYGTCKMNEIQGLKNHVYKFGENLKNDKITRDMINKLWRHMLELDPQIYRDIYVEAKEFGRKYREN
jgi:hypothetical protein